MYYCIQLFTAVLASAELLLPLYRLEPWIVESLGMPGHGPLTMWPWILLRSCGRAGVSAECTAVSTTPYRPLVPGFEPITMGATLGGSASLLDTNDVGSEFWIVALIYGMQAMSIR